MVQTKRKCKFSMQFFFPKLYSEILYISTQTDNYVAVRFLPAPPPNIDENTLLRTVSLSSFLIP